MVKLTSTAALALAWAAGAFATCDYRTSWFPHHANVTVGSFGYTGLNGPLNWYSLNTTANELCSKGRHQSPINLNSSIPTSSASHIKFSVDSYPEGAEFENLGTTVEVPVNGSLKLDNQTYSLAQFHFHTPSEHRIDLEYYPMEMHFVWEGEDKSTAVVAFLIELGPVDPLLASVFAYAAGASEPGQTTDTAPLDFVGLEHHLKESPVYRYSGSLTTPPCSENVKWVISSKPLRIDQGTYEKLKGIIKFNSRFTQNTLGGVNLLDNAASTLN